MAFTAGVVNSSGYGWAIICSLADAGTATSIGMRPLVLKIFQMGLKKGSFGGNSALHSDGNMEIAKMSQESSTHSWVSYLCLNTGIPV